MTNFGFKQAPSIVLFSALSAWSAVLAAENNGLRGRATTEIETELLGLSTVTPPSAYIPEEIAAQNFTMDSPEVEGRIIDGEPAEKDKFPYFVDMKWQGCGATHIEDEWILSAAHCDLKAGNRAYLGGAGAASEVETATVAECFPHPKYKWPDYDYTVCRLEQAYKKRKKVRIADADYKLKQDQPLTVIGKGRIVEGGEVAKTLQEAIVPYQKKEVCDELYGSFEIDHMVCAGGGSTDACQGDSGGPLFYEENGEYVQVGIVSWGSGCGRDGFPGVYAGVIEQRSWIEETICNNSVNSVALMCGGTLEPSPSPSSRPSASPLMKSSTSPSMQPSASPSMQPSTSPSMQPSASPSMQPSTSPSMRPSASPSIRPSASPSTRPSTSPSSRPSASPSMQPSTSPSMRPSASPSMQPSTSPSTRPSASPSMQPSTSPSAQPSPEPEVEEEDSHESTEVNCVDEGGLHYYKSHALTCSDIIEQMCVPFFKRKCPKTCDERCK